MDVISWATYESGWIGFVRLKDRTIARIEYDKNKQFAEFDKSIYGHIRVDIWPSYTHAEEAEGSGIVSLHLDECPQQLKSVFMLALRKCDRNYVWGSLEETLKQRELLDKADVE